MNLIGTTASKKSPKAKCVVARNDCDIGIKVSEEEIEKINISTQDKIRSGIT